MGVEPRELAIAALSDTFNEQRPALLKQATLPALAQAVENYRETMTAIRKLDEADRKRAGERLVLDLRPIGAKLKPEMSPEQARRWAQGIALSLSKWSFRVAAAA